MRTLQIQDVSLSFGDREILRNISFNMSERTRAALAGANGSGKSTLLKVIAGKMKGDSISVSMTKGARISYLPQSDIVLPEKSLYSAAEEGYSRFDSILSEMKTLEEIASKGGDEALRAAERLSELLFKKAENRNHTLRTRVPEEGSGTSCEGILRWLPDEDSAGKDTS